jgi:nucleotide-binding universal stress UspA family protein
MKIVVGIDGSASSAEALRWAAREARLHDTDITVVTAYRFPAAFAGTGAGSDVAAPDAQREAEALQQSMLDDAADALQGLDVTREIAAGQPPGSSLVKAAEDADLLVVDAHGRGGVSGFTIGSVSHYCVGHAACPVVVVPEAEARRP